MPRALGLQLQGRGKLLLWGRLTAQLTQDPMAAAVLPLYQAEPRPTCRAAKCLGLLLPSVRHPQPPAPPAHNRLRAAQAAPAQHRGSSKTLGNEPFLVISQPSEMFEHPPNYDVLK